MSKPQQDIRRKTRALEHAARTGNVRQTCRYFGIPRSLFYVWRAAYERDGAAGLINKTDEETLADFKDVFDFEEALVQGYRIQLDEAR